MDFKEKLKELPDSPGVYIFRDESGKVVYIGKASSLRDRVKSYFQPSRRLNPRLEAMVYYVRDVEWFVTPSEAEALLFEANLIKEYQPKYNVAYRDDKSYPFIKITMAEEAPKVLVTRGRRNDGSIYFGPYSNAKLLRRAVKSIRAIFPFRTCSPMPKRACAYYDMGLCPAPCGGKVSKGEYNDTIKQIILFIEGKKAFYFQVPAFQNSFVHFLPEILKVFYIFEILKVIKFIFDSSVYSLNISFTTRNRKSNPSTSLRPGLSALPFIFIICSW